MRRSRKTYSFGRGYVDPRDTFDGYAEALNAVVLAGELPPGEPFWHPKGVLLEGRDSWLLNLPIHWHDYPCHNFGGAVGHVYIHHLFLPRRPKASRVDVDHINANKADCRRINLRYLIHSENVRLGMQRKRNALTAHSK